MVMTNCRKPCYICGHKAVCIMSEQLWAKSEECAFYIPDSQEEKWVLVWQEDFVLDEICGYQMLECTSCGSREARYSPFCRTCGHKMSKPDDMPEHMIPAIFKER